MSVEAHFKTTDGVLIAGDLSVPADTRAAAIVCHPHPLYGGNRFNPVVGALFDALPRRGIATLRFDFRAEFGNGDGERLDALAALAELRRQVADVPTFAAGYSFGAMIALSLDDAALAGKVLLAPPLSQMDRAPSVDVPTLVLSPAHDQFAPPNVAEPIVSAWAQSEFATIESVDHFMLGRSEFAAGLAVDWIERHLPERG
jgi:alpha/beta superfamily hydrolase